MDNDPFNPAEQPDGSALVDNRPIIDPNKNYLEELVGEGKKFKSVEELARGKAESDAFIASLLREKKEALEELNKRMTVEDLLARMEGKNQNTMNNPILNQQNNGSNGGGSPESLNLDEIKAAVKAELERDASEARKKANITEASNKLKEVLGENAQAVLKQKAQELGVTVDYLRDVAATSPQMFYATIGLNTQQQTPKRNDLFTPPNPAVNTGGLPNQPQYGQHKPKSYYERLKQTDRKTYFDPKTSVQMHRDAIALGDKFFDI